MSRSQKRRKFRRFALAASAGTGAAMIAAGPAPAEDFTVTTLAPDGAPGSLRTKIEAAEAAPGADRILFQSGLSGTIELTDGQIQVLDDLQIVGPGSAAVAVDGGASDHIFSFYGGGGTPLAAGISGLTLQNADQAFGGAILSGNTNLTIDDSVLTGNSSSYNGAAIYAGLAGSLTIQDSTFTRNRSGTGGAIFVGNQDVLIRNSTFERNIASEFGGVLVTGYSSEPHTVEIENSTLVRNNGGLAGGAITPNAIEPPEGLQNPDLVIRSSTISGNQAIAAGGGIAGGFPSASIDNSIIAGNTAMYGPDLFSGAIGSGPPPEPGCGCFDDTIFDTGFSLIEDPSQAEINETVTGSNILNQDPGLNSLANNGGPTRTASVDPDSPVVNKGSSPLITDQRGDQRPVLYPGIASSAAAGANGADMGAFELQYVEPPPPPPPPPTPPVTGPFRILESTPNPKNGTAIVRVKVPAPGEVTLIGYKRLKVVKKRFSAAGIYKFRAVPKGNLRKNLRKRGRARVLVKFHYIPVSGRNLVKGRLFPFYKGTKGLKAATRQLNEGKHRGPWAGQ